MIMYWYYSVSVEVFHSTIQLTGAMLNTMIELNQSIFSLATFFSTCHIDRMIGLYC